MFQKELSEPKSLVTSLEHKVQTLNRDYTITSNSKAAVYYVKAYSTVQFNENTSKEVTSVSRVVS